MSDRLMRLKYLKTKMKLLCFFLLCITAVSVFGQSVELNGIVGKSIEFPAAVKIDGSWMYSGVTIGVMISGRFSPPHNGRYRDRVQWDSSTGLLSLSALRKNDSGEYKVENTQQKINTVFQLNVYEDNVPVLKPHVSVTHDEYPCTLLCAAARGTGVTLTLYREGEKNPYVTSPVESAPNLHLPQTVESGTYTCEAKNSVSRETSDPLTVEAHCTAPSGLSTGTIVAIVIVVLIAVLIAVVFAVLYWRIKRKIQGVREKKRAAKRELERVREKKRAAKRELKAFTSVIEVEKLLDKEDPHAYVTKSELEVTKSELEVTKSELEVYEILDQVDPHAYVKDEQPLFRDVRDFIFHRNAPKVMASFPQE